MKRAEGEEVRNQYVKIIMMPLLVTVLFAGRCAETANVDTKPPSQRVGNYEGMRWAMENDRLHVENVSNETVLAATEERALMVHDLLEVEKTTHFFKIVDVGGIDRAECFPGSDCVPKPPCQTQPPAQVCPPAGSARLSSAGGFPAEEPEMSWSTGDQSIKLQCERPGTFCGAVAREGAEAVGHLLQAGEELVVSRPASLFVIRGLVELDPANTSCLERGRKGCPQPCSNGACEPGTKQRLSAALGWAISQPEI